MNFRKFVEANESHAVFTDDDVVSMYFDGYARRSIKEIAAITGYSTGEIYRTLSRHHFRANRNRLNHHNVLSLASQGFSPNKIAEFTGYTPRNVRYILRNQQLSEG